MTDLFGRSYTRAELGARTGRLDALAGITEVERVGGRGRGARQFDVSTGGGLAFTAIAERALDVALASYESVPLCWSSCNEIANAAYAEPQSDGFLRTFVGGLFTTCGLGNFGPAGADAWGAFGLHGRINVTPAESVRYETRWDGDECTFEISATMRETRVFGENFRLDRRLRTTLGGTRLDLRDVVTNDAGTRRPHMILYHCNGGFPILDEDARMYVSHSTVRPRDDEAAQGLAVWDRGAAPRAGFAEQVFIHEPVACGDGRAVAMLWNPRLRDGRGLGIAVRYDPEQLPALFTWRMLGQGTYVMSMEPANCPTIDGRVAAGEKTTLPFLEAGESRTYDLTFDVLTDAHQFEHLHALIPADAMVR